MGLLINGIWHDQWYDTKATHGQFVRTEAQFRDTITRDGSSGYPAEAGRYHLYVSAACPWSHRAIIFRKLKGLDAVISMSNVSPHMLENGWTFSGEFDSDRDEINGTDFVYQLYTKTKPDYSGRSTVPILWDKQTHRIVNNESADIIRMLNSEFNEFTTSQVDYYPMDLRNEIDEINELVYLNINNGVYRCGFATTQSAYESAFDEIFAAFEILEARLSTQRYLVGSRITEADWRLFVTLIRFDAVYYDHFKCNLKRISDYPNLSNYLRDLYQHPGIAETTNFVHIKQHYYFSHTMINPTQIVPKGPKLNFNGPHDRGRFN